MLRSSTGRHDLLVGDRRGFDSAAFDFGEGWEGLRNAKRCEMSEVVRTRGEVACSERTDWFGGTQVSEGTLSGVSRRRRCGGKKGGGESSGLARWGLLPDFGESGTARSVVDRGPRSRQLALG